ncbi:hypothetical protein DSO57_1034771 [Entomophthora muscae]|uniref:Uncharacterized protein n=2 Tax=Entomophthora muscae TaxID=34485 RepID=A0ACC2SP14_9FUNG|nr:hypothetical protein DSO57_1034710 [Entomophthora muscae]KAJ9064025.1 hypothetical protein DSO57_1034771 [Entomophthora muscae]
MKLVYFSLLLAAASKPAVRADCKDYYYGKCIPCSQETYWDGKCHSADSPEIPPSQYHNPRRNRSPNHCQRRRNSLAGWIGGVIGNIFGDDCF